MLFGPKWWTETLPTRLEVITLNLHTSFPTSLFFKFFFFFHDSGAKVKDFQIPDSADAALIAEVNHYRNYSDITRIKLETQAAFTKERANHLQLKLQVKQKKIIIDILQGKIEKLQTEKTTLLSNKTALGEVATCLWY